MKQPYLTVYDYGMGGVWTYVLAESREQIEARLPDLDLVAEAPGWMTLEMKGQLRMVDIDDDDRFLNSLRR
ncbi:MAG: hypothetical protein HY873_08110 [Chloroflexi bacterium]|nr:hypothetical protein [Chloroflexota bacterium]